MRSMHVCWPMKRRPPNYRQLYAAAIAQLAGIPREHVVAMTVDQILSLAVGDHDPVPVAIAVDLGWTPEQYNHPSNLTIRLRADHRMKTATVDVPAIAKSRRISETEIAFRARLSAKAGKSNDDASVVAKGARKSQWPSRKMPSRKAAWPSRKFQIKEKGSRP